VQAISLQKVCGKTEMTYIRACSTIALLLISAARLAEAVAAAVDTRL
jgi:hypothetical protein